jgi:hypothetical protein
MNREVRQATRCTMVKDDANPPLEIYLVLVWLERTQSVFSACYHTVTTLGSVSVANPFMSQHGGTTNRIHV